MRSQLPRSISDREIAVIRRTLDRGAEVALNPTALELLPNLVCQHLRVRLRLSVKASLT
jgi:hypothetical protein